METCLIFYGVFRRVRKFAESDYWIRQCICVRLFLHPSLQNNSAPAGQILVKFNI
jgi:hypothetical protein